MQIKTGSAKFDFPMGSTLGTIERQAYEHATAPRPRWYGVSTGNGNDGVSHMFPDYYVWTGDPWKVAEEYAKSFVQTEYHDEIYVDGEADYTVRAELPSEHEGGYCPLIVEVFPADHDDIEAARADPWGKWCYASIQECLGR